MKIVDYAGAALEHVERYSSKAVSSALLADGAGEAHTYFLRFDAGGQIGEHPTGFGQLFVVIEGEGWVEGASGERVPISAGQAAYWERGETHSKGSDAGMTVIMIQVRDLELSRPLASVRRSSSI